MFENIILTVIGTPSKGEVNNRGIRVNTSCRSKILFKTEFIETSSDVSWKHRCTISHDYKIVVEDNDRISNFEDFLKGFRSDTHFIKL